MNAAANTEKQKTEQVNCFASYVAIHDLSHTFFFKSLSLTTA